MRDNNIIINPFEIINLLKCTITKEINNHYSAEVLGIISEKNAEKNIYNCAEDSGISICAYDESGDKKTIFKGIIETIRLEIVGGLYTIAVKASSYSILLDQRECCRTFQNSNQTYKNICEFIKSRNKNAFFIYTEGIKEKTKDIIVQYDETDWMFLKRIASFLHTVIVPDVENDNICLCFGIPEKIKTYTTSESYYQIQRNVLEYFDKNQNNVPSFSEQDAQEYIIETRDIWDLCSQVNFFNRYLFVYKIETRYEGQELIHKYYLRTKAGFKTKKQYNLKLIGVSLPGRIIKIKNDRVKTWVDVDDDQPVESAKWFLFSTVYSSPDGTGWYAMPEINDAVRLYFPDEDERNAYIVSAVHSGPSNKRRKKPNIKSFCTIYEKELEFAPGHIRITNNDGMMIELNDKSGITLVSNKNINLTSSNNITISGDESVLIRGAKGIKIQQENSEIEITDDIREIAQSIFHK